MIGEEKGSVAISSRSSHKMTGLFGNLVNQVPETQFTPFLNPFTPGTFTYDNPPIPWQFLVENKRTRVPKVNHMRSKTRDELLLSNKRFLFVGLMDSQGM